MNHKTTFGKGLGFLIIALLAVTAFFREPLKLWLYGGAFAVFAVWMLAALLFSRKRQVRVKPARAKKPRKAAKPAFFDQDEDSSMSAVLLRHVNYRVSAYIQSAYPGVTWEWSCKSPERIAVEGGTGRIKLFGVPDYNYAEVSFDRQARIGCELLRIVPLTMARGDEPVSSGSPTPPEQPVDPAVWYDLQGRDLLENIIADLHSRGHSSLTIRENGDICVRQAEKEAIQDRFSNMPGRSAWPGIVKILEKAGLAAAVADGGIKVSW
jgi:hypothetical protein